jgi:hypothetical protein
VGITCAEFYRKAQEIEACLGEPYVGRRVKDQVFQTKVTLMLGWSALDLRQLGG